MCHFGRTSHSTALHAPNSKYSNVFLLSKGYSFFMFGRSPVSSFPLVFGCTSWRGFSRTLESMSLTLPSAPVTGCVFCFWPHIKKCLNDKPEYLIVCTKFIALCTEKQIKPVSAFRVHTHTHRKKKLVCTAVAGGKHCLRRSSGLISTAQHRRSYVCAVNMCPFSLTEACIWSVLNFSQISSIKENVCVYGMCFDETRFCFLAGE